MKKYLQYSLGLLLGILLCIGIVFAAANTSIFEKFDFKNDDVHCSNKTCSDEDTWTFNVKDIMIFDSDKTDYQQTNSEARGLLLGTINSTLFGDFIMESGNNGEKGLLFYDSNETKCGANQHTYTVGGKIKSDTFGILDVVRDNSYFCPNSLEAFVVFHSDRIPKKLLLQSGSVQDKQNLENNPSTITFSGSTLSNIFEKQQVAIIGTTNVQGQLDKLLNESGNTQINEINTSSSNLPIVRSSINQKIATLKRNLIPINGNSNITARVKFSTTPSVTTNGEKIFYYDYTEKYRTNDNGYGNKGRIVKLYNSPSFSENKPSNYQIGITGKNTLLIEGANLYINADIYNNNDTTDLLTIIVKRDKNNHGGNIYVDPDVTNIDAIIVADGSLLSYRDSKILNRNTDNINGLLARQLHIYGSIFTRNTIGSKNVPFSTDSDLFQTQKSFPSKKENIYDLANLRAFQTRFADPTKLASNCGGKAGGTTTLKNVKRYWTAGYTTSNEQKLDAIKTYAWSGKRKCFNADINNITDNIFKNLATKQNTLRSSARANSLIIEYNPAVTNNTPYILQD